KAFKCFLKAAKNDNYMAQSTVAALYYRGIGVDKSPEKALKWFLIAAGNPETDEEIRTSAKLKAEELTGLLSPEKITSAQEQARLYKKHIEKKPIDITKIPD
ncbi:MAG: SEL1-like repeat protein, partial [Candidatus Riflebacteria bacterium]|nr:SEL1-like repeat protein [Candidatus Riflebacteria bacterium]